MTQKMKPLGFYLARVRPNAIYNIKNHTRTPRIIHDGIEGSQRQISIAPLDTKYGVRLAAHVVAVIREREQHGVIDLSFTEVEARPEPETMALRPVRGTALNACYDLMFSPPTCDCVSSVL